MSVRTNVVSCASRCANSLHTQNLKLMEGLDSHDFLALDGKLFVNFLNHLVVNFLKIGFSIFLEVFRESVLHRFFEAFDAIAASVAHSNLSVFAMAVTLLCEVATTFFRQGRYAQANHFAVVFGHDAYA